MVSSVAVLSDVHGVLPVLEAVLAEPDVRTAELIVVTGDHASGPMPVPVLDCLVELGERCLLVRGNADRDSLPSVTVSGPSMRNHAGPPSSSAATSFGCWPSCRTPSTWTSTDSARWCSATGRHATMTRSSWSTLAWTGGKEVFADLDAAVQTVVCGHTHMPFVRLVERRLVINPGSIGMPYGRPVGVGALRDGQVSLRHTPVDADAAIAAVIAGSTYPERAAWAEEYLRAANSDADALRAFGPRDGRAG